MKKIFLLFFLTFIFSCDNEIDINEEWQDIPVIYAIFDSGSFTDGNGSGFGGLLTPTTLWDGTTEFDTDMINDPGITYDVPHYNTTHFIRVQKAFLGSSSANDYVEISDSIYYNSADLDVWVEHIDIDTGEPVDDYYLELATPDEVAEIEKDYGDFNSGGHYLFKLPEGVLDVSKKYRISVLNNNNGKIASAETNIVEPLNVSINPHGPKTIFELNRPNAYEITIKPSDNAKMYSLVVRFNYLEQTKEGYEQDRPLFESGDLQFPISEVTQKYIEITLLDDFVVNNIDQASDQVILLSMQALLGRIGDGEILKQDMSNPQYYRYPLYTFEQNQEPTILPVRNILHRCLDIYITAVNTDFYTYLNSNAPTSGINQERPQYNNITNGIGHVSSRSKAQITNLRVKETTSNEFATSTDTKDLNFACFDIQDGKFLIQFYPDCD